MTCKKRFALLFLVTVSFYTPAESVLCRNTTVTENLSDPVIRHRVIGDVLARYLRSPNGPPRTQLGDEVADYILNLYNETDSPLLKSQLQSFALRIVILVLWGDPARGDFCIEGERLNASAQFAIEQNNRAILPFVNRIPYYFKHDCIDLVRLILSRMGCKKLPETECYKGPKCSDGGFVYPIKEILDTLGKHIPCRFRSYIFELYESRRYEDKSWAVTIMMSFTPLTYSAFEFYPADRAVEISNLMIDPNEKLCCCKEKRERLLRICEANGNANVDPIRDLFTTECPPEAAYQK